MVFTLTEEQQKLLAKRFCPDLRMEVYDDIDQGCLRFGEEILWSLYKQLPQEMRDAADDEWDKVTRVLWTHKED